MRWRLCSAAWGSSAELMQAPSKALEDPMIPSAPDQENMEAQIVAKRLKPRLKMRATECRMVRQLKMSQSTTHLQPCFHCVT